MKLGEKALEQLLLCAEDFYIIDDTTHELLYVSDSKNANYVNQNKKCYEVLYGLDKRCAQCPSTDLCKESQKSGANYYRWERFDVTRNIWYQVRHRVTTLDGRDCRIANCNVVEEMMQLGGDAIKEMGLLMNLLDENRKFKRQLEYDNTHDQMTTLYNRNQYTQDLERFDGPQPMGVAYLDINNLKEINDKYGHVQGDVLICATSRSMLAAAPANGRCYRIGGDEFVILLPNATAADSEQCRHNFLEALAEENLSLEHRCLTACGVASSQGTYRLAAVVAEAESNMYADKGRTSN